MSDQNPLHEDISSSPERARASRDVGQDNGHDDEISSSAHQNGMSGVEGFMQTLDDALHRGVAYARENPAIAVVGVASVAALLVIAAKKSAPRQSSLSRLEADVRSALANAPSTANSAVDTISGALGRAFSADPKNVQMFQDALSGWMETARSKIEPLVPNSIKR